MTSSIQSYVNLFHEVGMLALIPRSGFAFLGSGQQSVAEHSYRVTIIAYTLSGLVKQPISQYRLVMMCLFHDLPESRIGDLNYVQKKYVTANTDKVLQEFETQSPIGPEIVDWINEYERGETIESQLARDADQLELLLMLKCQDELGNPQVAAWRENCLKRLNTAEAHQLAQAIQEVTSSDWWLKPKSEN